MLLSQSQAQPISGSTTRTGQSSTTAPVKTKPSTPVFTDWASI